MCNFGDFFLPNVRKKCIFANMKLNDEDMDNKTDKPAAANRTNRTSLKKKAFLDALVNNDGNVTKACDSSGIGRTTFYRWKDEDQDFAASVESVNESLLDTAESELHKLIKKGNVTAIIFYLKTRGKERGYIERTETDSKVTVQDAEKLRNDILSGLFDEQS